MDADDPMVQVLLDLIAEKSDLRLPGIVCLSTGPLMVSIDGSGAVPGVQVDGLPLLGPGDAGVALWLPPSKPICFKIYT